MNEKEIEEIKNAVVTIGEQHCALIEQFAKHERMDAEAIKIITEQLTRLFQLQDRIIGILESVVPDAKRLREGVKQKQRYIT